MAGSIKESATSWVFSNGPLEEISNRCDIIIAASLVSSCTHYLECATLSLAASQPFGLPYVLHSHPIEPPQEYNVFFHCKGKKKVALEGKGTLCQLTRLDRFSSDAVLPDSSGKLWAGANGDQIATAGSPWNWELVDVYTHRRIPLPSICGFEPTPKKHEFTANGHLLHLLKIVVCRVLTTAGNYKNFSLLAIFDSSIAILHGSTWTVLENQFNMFFYRDAIIHNGLVFAVTQTCTVYVWDHLMWGNFFIHIYFLVSSSMVVNKFR
jgi:hypothetical protein